MALSQPQDDLVERVWRALAQVPDPEIPAVSVVDLGIVQRVEPGSPPRVVITPTYSGCPATLVIEQSIRAALDAAGLRDVRLATELSPAWTTDWITPAGRDKLKAYGIAPPPLGAARASLNETAAECPRCGSTDTSELSRFGSTPCKALWRCEACREPFDRFKCH